ncbi:MAG: hypothetical protein RMI91_07985 [Gemmatales bacterium]|nr:hypothetical protein [Gemmatales bacterium]MDW7994580.1 hypothetical protein [Gemmatales bacterium]
MTEKFALDSRDHEQHPWEELRPHLDRLRQLEAELAELERTISQLVSSQTQLQVERNALEEQLVEKQQTQSQLSRDVSWYENIRPKYAILCQEYQQYQAETVRLH